MTVKDYLEKNQYLLFDGAMGTYYAVLAKDEAVQCELANIENPGLIAGIHREYLQAGCKAVKTNTFGASLPAYEGDEGKLRQVLSAGWNLACAEAAAFDAFVFADMGPIPRGEDVDPGACYVKTVEIFLALGAENFLFETNSSDEGIAEAMAAIRAKKPEAFIAVSFAVLPDGYTRDGIRGFHLLERARAGGLADSVGFNCVCGAHHMLELFRQRPVTGLVSAMPNAGYPTVINGRTFYDSDPGYFAMQMAGLRDLGVRLLGGCCGTTPEHIRRTANVLFSSFGFAVTGTEAPEQPKAQINYVNRFWDKLSSGKRVVAVELDPPLDSDGARFMKNAGVLKDAGVDAVTIADCPVARARMDSSLLACKLKRELDMDPLPHMTCRDRNINATKALLLGLNMEGVGNVLVVTGDPIPTAERNEVKGVFSFNSKMLARYISDLNETVLPSPFRIFAALNVNAPNFASQLETAKTKLSCGVSGFLTQPVLSERAAENLALARKELDAYILGGIMPVVSHRNALYMNNEIAGITLDPDIIAMYEGKDKEACGRLAVELSVDFARRIEAVTDGWYIITPFQRVDIVGEIIKRLT